MHEWADRIVALMGDDSAFALDLKKIRVGQGEFDMYARHGRAMRYPVREDLFPGVMGFVGDTPHAIAVSERIVQLFACHAETASNEERMSMRQRIRFMIRAPDGDLAYMVDFDSHDRMARRGGHHEMFRFAVEKLMQAWAGRKDIPGYPA
jgi:hypothetical protein